MGAFTDHSSSVTLAGNRPSFCLILAMRRRESTVQMARLNHDWMRHSSLLQRSSERLSLLDELVESLNIAYDKRAPSASYDARSFQFA